MQLAIAEAPLGSQARAPGEYDLRGQLVELGLRGSRLHTNCLRSAEALGLRTYGVRYV